MRILEDWTFHAVCVHQVVDNLVKRLSNTQHHTTIVFRVLFNLVQSCLCTHGSGRPGRTDVIMISSYQFYHPSMKRPSVVHLKLCVRWQFCPRYEFVMYGADVTHNYLTPNGFPRGLDKRYFDATLGLKGKELNVALRRALWPCVALHPLWVCMPGIPR